MFRWCKNCEVDNLGLPDKDKIIWTYELKQITVVMQNTDNIVHTALIFKYIKSLGSLAPLLKIQLRNLGPKNNN